MPYLPIELDAKKKVPLAARAAGIHAGDLWIGLLDMWEQCFLTKREYVTEIELLGYFGDSPRVSAALTAFNFLEEPQHATRPGEWRIKGAERLLKDHAKRAGGLAAKGNLKQYRQPADPEDGLPADTGSPPAMPEPAEPANHRLLHPTPNTQHPTPKEEESAAFAKTAIPLKPKPRDRFASAEDFFCDVQHQRLELGYVTEKPPIRLGWWWSEVMLELGGDPRRLGSALIAFGNNQYWKDSNPPWPFRAFMKNWRDYVPRDESVAGNAL